MRLNDLFENNNKNRGYEPGFASPNAPSLGGRRQNDEPDGVNNIEVSINGRVWKIFAGAGLDSSPEFFRQKQKVDDMCKRKTQETGKKWTWGVTGAPATNESLAKNKINEFAPGQGGGDSGNYFQALASAWYNGTFDSGSLQKGIKSQEDVERLLQRGIVCPDGVTRKFDIGYNSDFDGVVISSDDYYEHADHDETDSRTGKPFGPYDYMEFGGDDLDESAQWRDPKYKGQLYTQEKPDYRDTREYDRAMWDPKPKGYPGRKELPAGGEYSNTDPLTKGFGRSGIKNSILDRGKRKGLPSRDQITSLKGSIRDAHGKHTRANLPEGMEGRVVFRGRGDDGSTYEIIQSGDDFMIHVNGKHIDAYGSLQRAMSVLKNEVPGLKKLNEAPVDLSQPQYQPVAQPEIDTGARAYAAPGSSVTGQDLAPSKFPSSGIPIVRPGDTKPTVDAGQIGDVFKAAQDREQEYQAWAADKRKTDPGYAARAKQYYQKDIVNPEFMNDLTDPGPEPVTPAKPVTSTAPVDNNAGATTGSALRDKINQAAGDQSDNSPLKAPNPVLSSPTQTAPTINKLPAKAPAANRPGLVAPASPNGVVTKAQLDAFRRDSDNPNATLGQYMNQQKGLTARKGGANDPAVYAGGIGKRGAFVKPAGEVKESAAQTDLYQILRNAGLKNTP